MKHIFLAVCLPVLTVMHASAAPGITRPQTPPKLSHLQAPDHYRQTVRRLAQIDSGKTAVLSEYHTIIKYVEERVKEKSDLLRFGKLNNIHVYREEYDDDGRLVMRRRERGMEYFPPKPLGQAFQSSRREKRLKIIRLDKQKALVYEEWTDGQPEHIQVSVLKAGVPEKYLNSNDIKGFYPSYGFEDYGLHKTLFAAVDERYYRNGFLENREYRSVESSSQTAVSRRYYPDSTQLSEESYTENGSPAYTVHYHRNGTLSAESRYRQSCGSDHRWYDEQGRLIRRMHYLPTADGCRQIFDEYATGEHSEDVYDNNGHKIR